MRSTGSRVGRIAAAVSLTTLVGLLGAACAAEPPSSDDTPDPEGTQSPDAGAFPDVIPLPDGFQPEGVAAGSDGEVFVGSLVDGDIWRGDARTGEGEVVVDAPDGRVAVGLAVDVPGERVVAAGGATGKAFFYDSRTGEALDEVTLTTADESTFINDVTLTPEGAWFTDSGDGVLHLVPFEEDGALGVVETLALQGPAAEVVGPFNLNGIDATEDGATLVVAHSGLEKVISVDPATGESSIIDVGADVPNGDGILLDGSRLWVVQNFLNQIAEIQLSDDLSGGEIVSVLTSEEFRVPTTVAAVEDHLVVVNARFDLENPAPTDEYELVVLAP